MEHVGQVMEGVRRKDDEKKRRRVEEVDHGVLRKRKKGRKSRA